MYWVLILLFLSPLMGALMAIKGLVKLNKQIHIVLAFAGGYILSITFMFLVPEVFQNNSSHFIGLIVLSGFFFQIFMEKFSEGIEHGHMHTGNDHMHAHSMPITVIFSLSLHSFIEGIPLGAIGPKSFVNLPLLSGILIHEIPAAFVLITVLSGMIHNRNKLYAVMILYCLMLPSGFLSSRFLKEILDEQFLIYILAFVTGTFLHISTTILFESSSTHLISGKKLMAVLAGVLLALISSFLHA